MDVSAAIKALKSTADVYGKAKKIPEQKQILEGLAVIAVLQQEKFDLEEQVRKLTVKLNAAQDKLARKEELSFADNSYWVLDKEGSRTDGPFCMSCFDVHGRKQRLTEIHDGYFHCPACKNSFLVDKKKQQDAINQSQSKQDSFFGY